MSKFDRNRIKHGWEKLCTNKRTDRHYENNGHFAVNQYRGCNHNDWIQTECSAPIISKTISQNLSTKPYKLQENLHSRGFCLTDPSFVLVIKAVTGGLGCLKPPEISGKNLTSFTKGSNPSCRFWQKLPSGDGFYRVENVAKLISAGACPGPHWGSLQHSPRPLAGGQAACCPSPRTQCPSWPFRPCCLHPKINPTYVLAAYWLVQTSKRAPHKNSSSASSEQPTVARPLTYSHAHVYNRYCLRNVYQNDLTANKSSASAVVVDSTMAIHKRNIVLIISALLCERKFTSVDCNSHFFCGEDLPFCGPIWNPSNTSSCHL